jgi:hypothetical protein
MINYILFVSFTNFKFLRSFSTYLKESNSENNIILHTGDLSKWDDKCLDGEYNIMCDLIKDIISYSIDSNVKKMHKVFSTKWKGVETIQDENFTIYRGFSPIKDSPLYRKWMEVYESGEDRGKISHGYSTYTSWTMSEAIAKSYAETRHGDLKVLLNYDVKNLKTFVNLFEIGDESEELIIYPFKERLIQYRVWLDN